MCQVPDHCVDKQYKISMSAANANRVSHVWASQNTSFRSQGTELREPNNYIWISFLKAVYNSCKLQRLLQVAKFLVMYSFTHTNIVFLFRHLATEIVIFMNVCYQMKCFIADSFSFFEEQILLIFHLLFLFNVKFKQGIQRH